MQAPSWKPAKKCDAPVRGAKMRREAVAAKPLTWAELRTFGVGAREALRQAKKRQAEHKKRKTARRA